MVPFAALASEVVPCAAQVVPCAAQVKLVKLVVLAWLVGLTYAVGLRVFAGTAAPVGHEASVRFVLDCPQAHHL